MYLASGPLQGRISHLLLNDIGPEVPAAALQRILTYVGSPPVFDSLMAYEQWLRKTYISFGPLTDETWRHLAVTSHRRTDGGKVAVHYDPQIVQTVSSNVGRVDMWAAYDAITCPTLLLRGATSDVLALETAEAMTRRGPKAILKQIQECGHAPLLDVPHQMQLVTDFLGT
jgi:pimeloyl-ACP methyl ester carboxylesterase